MLHFENILRFKEVGHLRESHTEVQELSNYCISRMCTTQWLNGPSAFRESTANTCHTIAQQFSDKCTLTMRATQRLSHNSNLTMCAMQRSFNNSDLTVRDANDRLLTNECSFLRSINRCIVKTSRDTTIPTSERTRQEALHILQQTMNRWGSFYQMWVKVKHKTVRQHRDTCSAHPCSWKKRPRKFH